MTMMIRLLVSAALLTLTSCSAAEPAAKPEPPTVDETFAKSVRSIANGDTDAEMVDEAKGACFEMEMHVKTMQDLELFIRIYSGRDVIAPEDTIPFLARSIKTYCPEMERLRPTQEA